MGQVDPLPPERTTFKKPSLVTVKTSVYSYRYTPFCFNSFTNSPLNSSDKYLKSLSDKLTNASRLEFINSMLSVKNRFLLIVKAMYFPNPFGMTLTFTSNLLIIIFLFYYYSINVTTPPLYFPVI